MPRRPISATFRHTILYAIVATPLLSVPLQAAAPGAMSFAAGGAGAWHQAIGGNGVAAASSEFASYWNPALTGLEEGYLLTLEHGEWFAGEMQKDILEFDLPAGKRAFSLNLLRNAVRGIPLSSSLEQAGEIGADNRPVISERVNSAQWQIGFSAAMELRPDLRVGGTTKLLYESMADLNSWGVGLDLGCWYRWRAVTAGLVVRDVVTTRLFWSSGLNEVVLPGLELGGSWQLPLPSSLLELHTTLLHDFNGVNYRDDGAEQPLTLKAGLVWEFRRLFHIGCGWDGSRLTAGTGLKYRMYGLNYALFNQEVLGTTHLVTLTADMTALVNRWQK